MQVRADIGKGGVTGYAQYASAYLPMNLGMLSIFTIHIAGNYFKVDLKTYYT